MKNIKDKVFEVQQTIDQIEHNVILLDCNTSLIQKVMDTIDPRSDDLTILEPLEAKSLYMADTTYFMVTNSLIDSTQKLQSLMNEFRSLLKEVENE